MKTAKHEALTSHRPIKDNGTEISISIRQAIKLTASQRRRLLAFARARGDASIAAYIDTLYAQDRRDNKKSREQRPFNLVECVRCELDTFLDTDLDTAVNIVLFTLNWHPELEHVRNRKDFRSALREFSEPRPESAEEAEITEEDHRNIIALGEAALRLDGALARRLATRVNNAWSGAA